MILKVNKKKRNKTSTMKHYKKKTKKNKRELSPLIRQDWGERRKKNTRR